MRSRRVNTLEGTRAERTGPFFLQFLPFFARVRFVIFPFLLSESLEQAKLKLKGLCHGDFAEFWLNLS